MFEYEVYIEEINPCGGSKHAKKEFLEIEAESPEKYVQDHGRFPILDIRKAPNGDTIISTGDQNGNFINYTFSE